MSAEKNPTLQKVVFVDRDGTILEEPADFQVDAFEKMRFVDGVIPALRALKIAGFKLVMVSNQDGLGTASFPRAAYEGPQRLMEQVLESAGAGLDEVLVCPHKPEDGCSCRKPATGLLAAWLNPCRFDPENTFVVGDRETDLELARRLGVTGYRVGPEGKTGTSSPGGFWARPRPWTGTQKSCARRGKRTSPWRCGSTGAATIGFPRASVSLIICSIRLRCTAASGCT